MVWSPCTLHVLYYSVYAKKVDWQLGTRHIVTYNVFTLYRVALICVASKIIPERASVHTKQRFWRRVFCDGATLRRANLESGASRISDRFCAILWRRVNVYSVRRWSNKFELGLGPIEKEGNIQEWELEFSASPHSQPRRHDVRCVWTTWAVQGRCCSYYAGWLFEAPRKAITYSMNIALGITRNTFSSIKWMTLDLFPKENLDLWILLKDRLSFATTKF